MVKHAYEIETLKEGTWYIRGCSELRDYFDKIECNFDGHISTNGYYIEKGKWDWDNIDYFQHRKEITLQDYLDSLKPQSFDELDLEIEEKEKGSIEFLKSRGYFVFPKAEEGDFPDLSNFKAPIMNVESGNVWYKGRKVFCKIWGNIIADWDGRNVGTYNKARHIQKPKLTLAELAEKAGLDINNIEIIE